jgi:hypothetical protein
MKKSTFVREGLPAQKKKASLTLIYEAFQSLGGGKQFDQYLDFWLVFLTVLTITLVSSIS